MSNDVINEKAGELLKLLDEEGFDPRNGLPDNLFYLASAITPIPNIDLLICDSENRLLLSWRDDSFYGKGWHLVGGCIRMHETLADRIAKTAVLELGTLDFEVDYSPVTVRDAIIRDANRYKKGTDFIRSHNLSVLYKCRIKEGFDVSAINAGKNEHDAGFLKWFDTVPDDLLPALENAYGDILKKWPQI